MQREPRFGWLNGVKRALNDRRMDMREARECARNRNEWQITQLAFLPRGPYRGGPVVGAGEMASMK